MVPPCMVYNSIKQIWLDSLSFLTQIGQVALMIEELLKPITFSLVYRALAHAVCEMVWISYVLKELHVSLIHKSILFTNSLSAKHLTTSLIMHAWMKHVKIDFHFIYDLVVNGSCDVQFTLSID